MRRFALTVSALGALLFAGLLALSWLSPLTLERAAREVLRMEVERRVGERIDALNSTRLAELAGKALAQTEADIAQTQERIRRDVPARVASVVADMMSADCECRRRMAAWHALATRPHCPAAARVSARISSVSRALICMNSGEVLSV